MCCISCLLFSQFVCIAVGAGCTAIHGRTGSNHPDSGFRDHRSVCRCKALEPSDVVFTASSCSYLAPTATGHTLCLPLLLLFVWFHLLLLLLLPSPRLRVLLRCLRSEVRISGVWNPPLATLEQSLSRVFVQSNLSKSLVNLLFAKMSHFT
jgi:hypothetical protein